MVQPAFKLKPLQEEIVLEGNKYTAVPLKEQGYQSYSFRLEPAFKYRGGERVPAILKRVLDPMSEEDNMDSNVYREIEVLKRVSRLQ